MPPKFVPVWAKSASPGGSRFVSLARLSRRKTLRAVFLRGRPFGCRCEAHRSRPVVLSSGIVEGPKNGAKAEGAAPDQRGLYDQPTNQHGVAGPLLKIGMDSVNSESLTSRNAGNAEKKQGCQREMLRGRKAVKCAGGWL